jgi:hypothetical protein
MTGKLDKAVLAYSVVLTTLLGGFAVTRAVSAPEKMAFSEIDVQRINLREKDGTLRMVIANTDRLPGIIMKGKEWPHASRRGAGILFFNDEGTENGGFGFGGARDKDGKVESNGNLSFDQYEQDQVVHLFQTERNGRRAAGLQINDRPDAPLDIPLLSGIESMPDGPEKQAKIKALIDAGAGGHPRLFVGKADKASVLSLKDAKGKDRLMLKVDADGTTAIQFLDETGKVVKSVSP